MTPADVHNTYKQVLSDLSQGKLKSAFEKTEYLNIELQSPTRIESLNNMQTSYRYMLQYFIDGINDPERKLIYNKLIAALFVLISQIREDLLTRDSSNYEFSQKRYFPFTPQIEANQLIDSLNRIDKKADIIELESDNSPKIKQVEVEFENALRFLFNFFWLKSAYDTQGMMEVYNKVMDEDYKDSTAKSILVSALTLNLWRTFDESKLFLLLDACNSSDIQTRQRALIGLCFVLAKYNRFLPYFPAIRNRLIIMTDDNNTIENLQNAIIQIIATTETEQISKKLQEEIFPELMKLRPMMEKGFNPENLFNSDEWGEINPEWQEMIDKSGASDKIQELAEMEMSGADVYMSTFSMLKSFPFFSEFSNWFLPFDTNHSSVNQLFQSDEKSLISAFLNSNVMCNSDRYSFCLSILQMPDMQRNMMKQSFSEATEQMEEMNKEEALYSPQAIAKSAAKHYVRDLFRFFKLNSHRSEFADMFATSLVMHKTYLFDLLSTDDNTKAIIAEYYFSKKLYQQALELYSEIEKEGDSSAIIYQKMGYAYQQTSQLTQALNAYKKADLLQPDDFWTNRKMAMCFKLTGDNENALNTYRHAHFIKPDNISVQLQIVHCLIELKMEEEALAEVIKIQKKYPDNQKALRLTVICSFTAKNLPQANYFASILLDTPNLTAHDYVLAGHIAWCMNKNSEAKRYYTQSLQILENNWEAFVGVYNSNKDLLIANNVDEKEIPLILDALQYNQLMDKIQI